MLWAEELDGTEHLLDKCLGGFTGLGVLVLVLEHHLPKHTLTDLVKGDLFQGVVHHHRNWPVSTNRNSSEELSHILFHHIWNDRQRVCNLRLDCIKDQLLQPGGD